MNATPATIGVVIRFKDSAATLPEVLEAIQRQTRRPDRIVGVNTGASDNSAELITRAGGTVVPWTQPYHHARVLNFGISQCPTDLVLVVSSHTVLKSPDAIERLAACMEDPNTACASGRWDEDPHHRDVITIEELRGRGMKIASIYTNSMGMFRRAFWTEAPFDETLVTMEDYAWALDQAARGRVIRRIRFDYAYLRQGRPRHFTFTCIALRLARRYGLRLAWLGPRGSLMGWLKNRSRTDPEGQELAGLHLARLRAWLLWRWASLDKEV
jgi:glycosyltransferase involved in cell wall biosynthesis